MSNGKYLIGFKVSHVDYFNEICEAMSQMQKLDVIICEAMSQMDVCRNFDMTRDKRESNVFNTVKCVHMGLGDQW